MLSAVMKRVVVVGWEVIVVSISIQRCRVNTAVNTEEEKKEEEQEGKGYIPNLIQSPVMRFKAYRSSNVRSFCSLNASAWL